MEFATRHWDERWVIADIQNERLLDNLLRRPFFLFVSIEAPTTTRWARFKSKYTPSSGQKHASPGKGTQQAQYLECTSSNSLTFEDFVAQSDRHLYHPVFGLARLIAFAEVRLINSSSSLSQLHDALEKLDLIDAKRLRPSWDQYFMQLASLAAQRSNCMKRRVGCVLVWESRVVSTGYNGTPRNLRNCNDGGCMHTFYIQQTAFKMNRSEMQPRPAIRNLSFDMPMYSRRRKCSSRGREGENPARSDPLLQYVRGAPILSP